MRVTFDFTWELVREMGFRSLRLPVQNRELSLKPHLFVLSLPGLLPQ